jgi:hypothetical protein
MSGLLERGKRRVPRLFFKSRNGSFVATGNVEFFRILADKKGRIVVIDSEDVVIAGLLRGKKWRHGGTLYDEMTVEDSQ